MNVIKYNYEPFLKKEFIDMNVSWINRDYILEDEDIRILNEIDLEVQKGAIIYFAIENDIPISTLMLTPIGNDVYELVKFATKEGYENKGAGSMLLDYALKEANSFAKEIVIATNKKCLSAIHLYKKYGFLEYDAKSTFGFSSSRVDICFKLIL